MRSAGGGRLAAFPKYRPALENIGRHKYRSAPETSAWAIWFMALRSIRHNRPRGPTSNSSPNQETLMAPPTRKPRTGGPPPSRRGSIATPPSDAPSLPVKKPDASRSAAVSGSGGAKSAFTVPRPPSQSIAAKKTSDKVRHCNCPATRANKSVSSGRRRPRSPSSSALRYKLWIHTIVSV